MKRHIIAIFALVAITCSCDITRLPEDSVTPPSYFKTEEDFRLWSNAFYTQFSSADDLAGLNADDVIDNNVQDCIKGSRSAATENWSWTQLRNINYMLEKSDQCPDPAIRKRWCAVGYFFRAYFYARLVTCWGDVPFYTRSITADEAYEMGRTDKEVVKKQVYDDYDAAIAGLPEDNNNGGVKRVDKGAAIALKARAAIYWGDYAECARLCKELMDMGKYSLYPDYGELFRQKSYTCETIFSIANGYEYEQFQNIKSFVLRTAGGTAVAQPSWDLLAAYECTDGKLITESPLFDPHNPYDNRDPRCCETFAKPGTTIYGVVFDPSPVVTKVYDSIQGKEVKNKDTKTNDNYAPYNGCCLRKGAQEEWRTGLYNDNPQIIIRYADVLLMYAESKIELNQIDATVLNAINDVRARAYGVKRTDTDKYPSITTTNQKELRTIVRRERRVEFPWEGRR